MVARAQVLKRLEAVERKHDGDKNRCLVVLPTEIYDKTEEDQLAWARSQGYPVDSKRPLFIRFVSTGVPQMGEDLA